MFIRRTKFLINYFEFIDGILRPTKSNTSCCYESFPIMLTKIQTSTFGDMITRLFKIISRFYSEKTATWLPHRLSDSPVLRYTLDRQWTTSQQRYPSEQSFWDSTCSNSDANIPHRNIRYLHSFGSNLECESEKNIENTTDIAFHSVVLCVSFQHSPAELSFV